MKQFIFLLSTLFLFNCSSEQKDKNTIVTTDLDHFWEAYDKVTSTSDSLEQMEYLNELFIDKASDGQKAMFEARRYTPEAYLEAINNYPLFWESIRENTYKAKDFSVKLEEGVEMLRDIYPDLKPAKIYFTMGVFRSGGTTMDSLVLIGSEISMADENTVSSEFPDYLSNLENVFSRNPINDIVFLNIHEYVHTQQNSAQGSNLLVRCMNEGVAEFVAEKASGQASISPAISVGKEKDARVREKFEKEMFSHYYQNWLWSNLENEFGARDMGYYVGYAISNAYYEATDNKKEAIKTLIELDYQDRKAVEEFVEATGYFSKPISELEQDYINNTPEVIGIKEFKNGDQNVNPNTKTLTLEFSQPMDPRLKNTRIGPLGEDYVLPVNKYDGFSEDGKIIYYGMDLEPNKRYQLLIHDQFRSVDGVLLKPYLIDIKTAKN